MSSAPFKPGHLVDIYEDVLTRERLEGRAMIVSYEGPTGSADVYRYRVIFPGEGEAVYRNILDKREETANKKEPGTYEDFFIHGYQDATAGEMPLYVRDAGRSFFKRRDEDGTFVKLGNGSTGKTGPAVEDNESRAYAYLRGYEEARRALGHVNSARRTRAMEKIAKEMGSVSQSLTALQDALASTTPYQITVADILQPAIESLALALEGK